MGRRRDEEHDGQNRQPETHQRKLDRSLHETLQGRNFRQVVERESDRPGPYQDYRGAQAWSAVIAVARPSSTSTRPASVAMNNAMRRAVADGLAAVGLDNVGQQRTACGGE